MTIAETKPALTAETWTIWYDPRAQGPLAAVYRGCAERRGGAPMTRSEMIETAARAAWRKTLELAPKWNDAEALKRLKPWEEMPEDWRGDWLEVHSAILDSLGLKEEGATTWLAPWEPDDSCTPKLQRAKEVFRFIRDHYLGRA